jgi:glycosyltransferase involved in cell wall biosynthesis
LDLNPLLTIAIPTYNRALILDGALNKILPQISKHRNIIEFILSDNASTDNTQEVIKKNKEKYSEIKIITNLQPYNTGYFGNFKKCKEISNGKYFWLLSDNDHIQNGVVDFLISILHSTNDDVGAYYLADNSLNRLNGIKNNTNTLKTFQTKFGDLLKNKSAWLLTLISSVVFLNDKRYDNEALAGLNENPFLGFIFLCNALRLNKRITIINGNIYTSVPCNVYFDLFKAFTKDILECVEYMVKINLLDLNTKEIFISGYMETHLLNHVIAFRRKKHSISNFYNIVELRDLLDSFYSDSRSYNRYVRHFLFSSKIVFYFHIVLLKIKRKMAKIFWYLTYRFRS